MQGHGFRGPSANEGRASSQAGSFRAAKLRAVRFCVASLGFRVFLFPPPPPLPPPPPRSHCSAGQHCTVVLVRGEAAAELVVLFEVAFSPFYVISSAFSIENNWDLFQAKVCLTDKATHKMGKQAPVQMCKAMFAAQTAVGQQEMFEVDGSPPGSGSNASW